MGVRLTTLPRKVSGDVQVARAKQELRRLKTQAAKQGRAGNHAVALLCVDPGGVTGAACGVFRLSATVKETLLDWGDNIHAWEVRGDPPVQALSLLESLIRLRKVAGSRMPVRLVIESFQLRQQRVDLSPVQVTSGLLSLVGYEGLADGTGAGRPIDIRYQSPSQAKTYGTRERLQMWGLYGLGRGSDHKRDALRHLALAVARELGAS